MVQKFHFQRILDLGILHKGWGTWRVELKQVQPDSHWMWWWICRNKPEAGISPGSNGKDWMENESTAPCSERMFKLLGVRQQLLAVMSRNHKMRWHPSTRNALCSVARAKDTPMFTPKEPKDPVPYSKTDPKGPDRKCSSPFTLNSPCATTSFWCFGAKSVIENNFKK